jgi:N-hydroxyarylamine O-acetyltransferase
VTEDLALDLAAYFNRIEYQGPTSPTLDTLQKLHLAHATHIPFENLDVLLRRPIRLDLPSLFAKLVTNQRGGYCFEQNRLFASVLELLGFSVTCLSARVQMGATEPRARTHMLLSVQIDGQPWLADVGFGHEGLLHPILLQPGHQARQFAWQYRIVANDGLYTLQSLHAERWFDLYRFTLEPHHPIDYEVANHYTSTYPESRFTLNMIAAKPGPERRLVLWNGVLTEQTATAKSETRIASDEDLLRVLDSGFRLRFPPGTKFQH